MKKNTFLVFLFTYIVATLVRALTGVDFNPFIDKFDLILFLKDISIWTVSYLAISLLMSKFSEAPDSVEAGVSCPSLV